MEYTVKNIYNIRGEQVYNEVEKALKARDKREGLGWIVVDGDGNRWDYNSNNPVIVA